LIPQETTAAIERGKPKFTIGQTVALGGLPPTTSHEQEDENTEKDTVCGFGLESGYYWRSGC